MNTATNGSGQKAHRFQRFGATYHLKIDNHEDLERVLELDEAHWVATTAPTATLNSDAVFLDLLDTDNDGRLRPEEIKDAIRFLFENLSDRSGISPGNTRLDLDKVDPQSEVGQRIQTSASKIIDHLVTGATYVTLDQVRAIKAEVQKGGLDEAGIVLPGATDDERLRKFADTILATVGGASHPRGDQGVDENALDTFLEQCRKYLDWSNQAVPDEGKRVSAIMPLGKTTHEAYALFEILEKKIDQFFLLCSIKELNPEMLLRAFAETERSSGINVLDLSAAKSYLSEAPLAPPNQKKMLDLSSNINPFYSRTLNRFGELAIVPLLGEAVVTIDQTAWHQLRERFQPYRDWLEVKPDVTVEEIPVEQMKTYVTDSFYRDGVKALIEKSHRTAFVMDNIKAVERLILYQANILPLVNSFVSFPQLYDPEQRALFEMGTLVMDGRHFTLAIKVLDRERHLASSSASNIFVMYLEVYGRDKEKLYEVAVPVTSGNRGNIRLGKWGIFNDVNGQEWHAKIVQIIESPISIVEAMIHPFKRVGHSLIERLEQMSATTEERISGKVGGKAPKKSSDKKKEKTDTSTTNLLAGGGVAIAALGSSVAFIVNTFSKLNLKIVIGTILVLALALVVPVAISTYYKLTRRDLSSILEGSGWGVNARMKLTRRQANTFTRRPKHGS